MTTSSDSFAYPTSRVDDQQVVGRRCLHELFEDQARAFPDRVAAVYGTGYLTYETLNHLANTVACFLQFQEVQPEQPIGICLPRSLEMVIAILGVLKSGCAYVPLDPQYPDDRLQTILREAGLSLLLTNQSLLNRWPHSEKTRICGMQDVLCFTPPLLPEASATKSGQSSADQLAYILYTSGSTGVPKGVMIQHRSVVALLDAFEKIAPRNESLAGTSLCSFGFDVSVWEIFSLLCFGGTLHLLPADNVADGQWLSRYLREQAITSAYLPAQLLPDIAHHLEQSRSPVHLARILVGVEPIQQKVLQRYRDLQPGMRIINGYGPTETTICATFFAFLQAVDDTARTPIGTAISGYEVFLLNERLSPIAEDEIGEIYVGGAGLARGYLYQPGLTAEKFIPHPFSDHAGSRFYKTGDAARAHTDGTIEFVERVDRQVKIRGFRVELGEIEAALSRHPIVQSVFLTISKETIGSTALVAYVVPAPHNVQEVNTTDLRQFLQSRLPDYMIPTLFISVESFPLTPNGKIDHQALPKPTFTREPHSLPSVAPRDSEELMVARAWMQISGIETLSVFDNFFEAGGHSLHAGQFIARLREFTPFELTLKDVFTYPNVAEFATFLRQGTQRARKKLPALYAPVPRPAHVPLSTSQEGLWFLHQLYPQSCAFTIPLTLSIRGCLNIKAFEYALYRILQRHEALRTYFSVHEGVPEQQSMPDISRPFSYIDLRGLAVAERQPEARRLAECLVRRPFDLAQDQLLRSIVFLIDDRHFLWTLTIHHLVFDGWSKSILYAELQQLYTAYSTNQATSLSSLPLQFADFCLWQRASTQHEWLKAGVKYWTQQLAGSAFLLPLPADYPRPSVQTFEGAHYQFHIPAQHAEILKRFALKENVTLFMLLLSAFQLLLYRYTGQQDILIGIPAAGRTHKELEGLIGFFVNTLVMRGRPQPEQTVHQFLQAVRLTTLDAYEYQDVPFETLVTTFQIPRNLSYNPLIQVMFALQTSHGSMAHTTLTLPDLEIEPYHVETGASRSDLTLEFQEDSRGLQGQFEYNHTIFEKNTIASLARHLQHLLVSMVEEPVCRISRLSMLSEAERRHILQTWNATHAPYTPLTSLPQMFHNQAMLHADAIAVTLEVEMLTWRELDQRANQFAHYLCSQGVGPEDCIGLYLDRTPEQIIGMLAILKAGGAYVPLDPSYPSERLKYICQNAHVSLLLTSTSIARPFFASASIAAIYLDRDKEKINQYPLTPPPDRVHPDNLAYVIYTSGSTGYPKGVQITHRSAYNLVIAQSLLFETTPEDRILQFASLSFDVSVWEIFLSLRSGATLCLLPSGMVMAGQELFATLEKQAITNVTLPPSALQTLPDGELSHLRILMTGGEACSARLVNAWSPGRTYMNVYGPTEATVWTTVAVCKTDPRKPAIGHPMANMEVYVLDASLCPVPVGVTGDLYIGGMGLARGYRNRPDLTAERFLPHPFSESEGARLYLSGDLARYREDGSIEFLGRADSQVKIRGFRIELSEIERVLQRHPALQDAVVEVFELQGDKKLVGYVVPSSGTTVSSGGLRAFVQEYLPAYMLPSTFVFLDRFPLTPNKKIDRRNLPAPTWDSTSQSEGRSAAPRSPLEAALMHAWRVTLGLPKVSIQDNFFEIGGHSLKAIELLARIKQEIDVEVPLSLLFEAPTIASIAEVLTAETPETLQGTVRIQKGREGVFPLFLFHGIGGYVMSLWRLGTSFPPEQPVYAIQGAGLNYEVNFFTRLEAMAAYYIHNIRRIQPSGPYHLIGKSSGGVIVLEMAKQLEQMGEQVFAGLLDSSLPEVFLHEDMDLRGAVRTVFGVLSSTTLDFASQMPDEEVVPYYYHLGQKKGIIPNTWQVQDLQHFVDFVITQSAMFQLYAQRPAVIEAPLYLFAATLEANTQPWRNIDRWAEYTQGELHKIPIPGTHDSISFPPNVSLLVQAISTHFGLNDHV